MVARPEHEVRTLVNNGSRPFVRAGKVVFKRGRYVDLILGLPSDGNTPVAAPFPGRTLDTIGGRVSKSRAC